MLDPVWEELVARLERGATLAEVEEALVEVPGLSEDERAALWLAAWSYRPGGGDLAEWLTRTA
jgi:hypothetical protein